VIYSAAGGHKKRALILIGYKEGVLVLFCNKQVEKSCKGLMPEILVVFGDGRLLLGVNSSKRGGW